MTESAAVAKVERAASLTVAGALRQARAALAGREDGGLAAQLLLADALSVERSALLAHPEWPLGARARTVFQRDIARFAQGEPLAYIRGRREFYDREFRVTKATLIPRPETELLLEAALASAPGDGAGLTVADIGTGCGALAICFKAQRPAARVIGSDISAAALAVARENGASHGVAVEWLRGDLLAPLRERGIVVERVLANLPYIATDELATLAVGRSEPRLALDGGHDGLRLIERLLSELPAVCAPAAQAWLEIGAGQGAAVMQLAARLTGARAALLPDYAGIERILRLRFP